MIPEKTLREVSIRRYELLSGKEIRNKIRPRLGDHVWFVSLQLRIIGSLSFSRSMGAVLFEAGKKFTRHVAARTMEMIQKFPGSVSLADADNLEEARASLEFTLLQKSFQQTREGLLRLTEYKKGKLAVVQSEECSDCYGIGNLEKSICYFSGGAVAGALENALKRSVGFIESKCYCKGDDCCEFRYNLDPLQKAIEWIKGL